MSAPRKMNVGSEKKEPPALQGRRLRHAPAEFRSYGALLSNPTQKYRPTTVQTNYRWSQCDKPVKADVPSRQT